MTTTTVPMNKSEVPATSLRDFISSFVRKGPKVQNRGKSGSEGVESKKIRRHSSYSEAGGMWDREFSSDSFLELSEASPVDEDVWNSGIMDGYDPKNDDANINDNGNLWKDEVRRKCVQLTRSLEHQLSVEPKELLGLNLKFPENMAQRIATKIVNTASSEPCGLRGCCINLRLLHEDVANVLMTGQSSNLNQTSGGRAEKCASWPEPPVGSKYDNTSNERRPLDFRFLPDMDSALTANFSPESSTDSGFADGMGSRRGHLQRRVHYSASTPSMSDLPKLSAASRLQVACADLGRIDLCDSDSVPTFEVYVYLAPSTSWTWWLRKLFSSSLKMEKSSSQNPNNKGATRALTIVPDFTIVKRKLYRSRSNSVEVIRCPQPS